MVMPKPSTPPAAAELVESFWAMLGMNVKRLLPEAEIIIVPAERVSLADAMKYGRLDKLEADIQKELKLLGRAQVKQTRQLLKDVYVESFARTAHGIENQVARLGD
jgi:hypothetical protein